VARWAGTSGEGRPAAGRGGEKAQRKSRSAHICPAHSDAVLLPLRRYPIIPTFALGVGQKRLPIALHLQY